MADQIVRDTLQGLALLLPRGPEEDPRTELLTSGTLSGSYTQASPYPALPVPSSSNLGRLGLVASGSRRAGDPDLEVRLESGGHPAPIGDVRMLHREAGVTDWFGRDVQNLITAWEPLEWTDGSGSYTVLGTTGFHSLGLPSGRVLLVYQDRTSTLFRVRVAVRNPLTGAWTKTTVYSQSSAPPDGFYPCVWAGEDSRVYVGFWTEDTASNRANIRVHYATDEGASGTWPLLVKGALWSDIDTSGVPGPGNSGYDLRRIRAAVCNGQTCLVAHLVHHNTGAGIWRDVIAQYASDDVAMALRPVEIWSELPAGPGGLGYPELLVVGGRFLLLGIAGDLTVKARKFDSAWDASSTVPAYSLATFPPAVVLTARAIVGGELAACVDFDESVSVYSLEDLGGGVIGGMMRWSKGLGDEGTFQVLVNETTGADGRRWIRMGDTATYPARLTCCPHAGRILLAHGWEENPGNEGSSLAVMHMGGNTTLTMPDRTLARADYLRVPWNLTWLPFDEPHDVGWTQTTGGVFTNGLASPGHEGVTTTAGQNYWTINITNSLDYGVIVMFESQRVSGGSPTIDDLAFEVCISDGAGVDYTVRGRIYSTGYTLYDVNAAASVGAGVVETTTGYFRVLLAMAQIGGVGVVRTWHQPVDLTSASRTWTVGPTSSTLTAGVAVQAYLRKGHLSAAGTASSRWRMTHAVHGAYVGQQLAGGFTNPDDLYGTPLPAMPYPVADGVLVSAKGGPGYPGDTWTIGIAYEFALTNILPRVSRTPRTTWRSTQVAAQEVIVWEANSAADQRTPEDILVMSLEEINFRTGILEGRKAGPGTWTTLVTLDAAIRQNGLRFVRNGRVLYPDITGASTNNPWIPRGDLVGGYALLDAVTARTIIANTPGYWDDDSTGTHKRPTVSLSLTGGEPSSGTALALVAPRVFASVHLAGETYSHFRLRIPAQVVKPPGTYFEIGRAFLGYLSAFGWRYDWPWGHELEDGAEAEELDDGSSVVREARPIRRIIDFAWSRGILSIDQAEGADPDYILGTSTAGAPPVAAPYATAWDLLGIYRELGGSRWPCLYVEQVPRGTPDAAVSCQRNAFLCGRIPSAPRLEAIGGEERAELLSVQTIAVREDV